MGLFHAGVITGMMMAGGTGERLTPCGRWWINFNYLKICVSEQIRISIPIYHGYKTVSINISIFMQPDNKSLHLGDGQTDLFADRVLYLHARRYNDPRSLWLVQYWSADRFMTWTLPKFQKLLYKDFTRPLVTLRFATGLVVGQSRFVSKSLFLG